MIRTKNRYTMYKIITMFYMLYYAIGKHNDHLIYILMWESAFLTPVFYETTGQIYFIDHNCSYRNCFVTENRSILSSVTHFDAIMFNSVLFGRPNLKLPTARAVHQKYIFMSTEPASMYPMSTHYNGFFNFTFTYKLDSDATWRFYVVRNKTSKKVIAPKDDVIWMDINDMEPISEEIKIRLETKSKAAAWYASHCVTYSQREQYVVGLKVALEKFGLGVDVFGLCGEAIPCKYWNESCHIRIERDYYFYLAFENSMCYDYVSEKILTATDHYTVPIVFGGANYSRFLPDGSYINASYSTAEVIAATMNDIIQNKSKYYEFFKWHNHYIIEDDSVGADADEVCGLCAFLNIERHQFKASVYTHINWYWMH